MAQVLNHSDIIDPENQSNWIYQFYSMLQQVNNRAVSGKSKAGYFCLSDLSYYRDEHGQKRSYMKKWYSRNLIKLLGQHVYKNPLHDWFITPTTFIRRSSKAGWNITKSWYFNNIHTITSFYLDFDVVKAFGGSHIMMRTFRYYLPMILHRCGLDFTYLVMTGNGYHAYIVLNKGVIVNNPVISKLWKDVQEAIIKRVSDKCRQVFGSMTNPDDIVDPKVSNINRILRIAGSFNMKDPKFIRSVRIEDVNPDYRPSFWDVKREMLGGRIVRKSASKRSQRKPRKTYRIKRNHGKERQYRRYQIRRHHKTGHNARTLNASRCEDIWRHVKTERQEYNNGNPDPMLVSGHRDSTIFDFITSAIYIFRDNSVVAKNLIEINRTFPKSKSKGYMTRIIGELPYYRKMIHSTHGGRYHPTNEQIIGDLNIKDKEQKHMKTLIGQAERKKRYQHKLFKQKKQRILNHIKLYRREYKMMILHQHGKSYRVIANTFGISHSTAIRTIRKVTSRVVHDPCFKYVVCNKNAPVRSNNHYSIHITNDFKAGLASFRKLKLAPVSHNSLNSDKQQELRLNHILKLRRRAYRKRMTGDD